MGKILKLSRIIDQKFCFINIVGLTVKIQINLITDNQCSYLPVDFFYVSASYGLSQNETVEKICNNFKRFFPPAGKTQDQYGKDHSIQHQSNNTSYPHTCLQNMSLLQIIVKQHARSVRGFSFFSLFFTIRQSSRSLNCPSHPLFHMEKNYFRKKRDTNNLPGMNLEFSTIDTPLNKLFLLR